MSPKPEKAPMKIDKLAAAAGVPVRTVRYYLARGVLPAPEFRGPHTVYGPEYLARLRAIQKLQEDYLPLDAIAAAVAGRSVEELEMIARDGVGRRVLVEPLSAAASRAGGEAGRLQDEVEDAAEVRYRQVELRSLRKVRAVRWQLASGVELVVDEDAPPAARRLVDRWLESLREPGEGTASEGSAESLPPADGMSVANKTSRKRTGKRTRG